MLIGIAIFLLFVIVLLAIPVTLTFQVSRQQVFRARMTLKWAFGLVRVRIPLSNKLPSSSQTEAASRNIHRATRHSTRSGSLFTLIRQRAFRRRILTFVSDLWHAVDKRNIHLRVRLGLGDPADTGQLWAVVGPVAAILANVKEARLEIEPEFMETVFELHSSGTIRLIPLQIITLVLVLLLSPSVWHGIRQMRNAV